MMILLAMGGGYIISWLMKLNRKEQRTLIIEIGMQNAAQSIAIASSPFIFNNDVIAIPAIIYALMMNIILLFLRRKTLRLKMLFMRLTFFRTP